MCGDWVECISCVFSPIRLRRPSLYGGIEIIGWHRRQPAPDRQNGYMSRFSNALNGQIAYEFAASQQYIAIAVHYDALTLPQLAAHFYRQAVEERNHAMMMVQYLLDADEPVTIPAVAAPVTSFADDIAPVRLALDQEKRVTGQIQELAMTARGEGDLVAEQFMHWFLQEQREEVSSMSALLTVIERSKETIMHVEAYLARESGGENPLEQGAPPAAGGEL